MPLSTARMTPPRVPPIDPDSANDVQKALLNGWWRDLNFSRVMAQHPDLYKVYVPVIEKVIARTNLPPRDRQILVLRTLALCDEVYESTHHAHIAHNVGMTEADIEAARTDGASLSSFEHTLTKAAEELVRGQCISDATWGKLGERYSQIQQMEVVGLVGTYVMLATIMRSYGIQLETGEELKRLQAQRNYK